MSEEKYVELLEDGELFNYIQNIQQQVQGLKRTLNDKCMAIKALKIALKERTAERDAHSDKEYLYKSVIDEMNIKQKEYDIKANGMSASDERDELIIKARAYREILTKANIKERE